MTTPDPAAARNARLDRLYVSDELAPDMTSPTILRASAAAALRELNHHPLRSVPPGPDGVEGWRWRFPADAQGPIGILDHAVMVLPQLGCHTESFAVSVVLTPTADPASAERVVDDSIGISGDAGLSVPAPSD